MRCDVCGLEYGMSHNCPGQLPTTAQEMAIADLRVPANAGLGYYLGEALKIVRWDDIAIRRNAKDRRATIYGLLLWSVSMFLVLLVTSLPALLTRLPKGNPIAQAVGIIFGLTFGFIAMAVLTLIQLGLCHLIAKWIFGATGRFVEVMRPLLLGWFVNVFIVVPVAGTLLAAIGWTAVLMMVFEEVDGIERLQAFGISAGVNFCFLVLRFWMMPVTHHL